jgi:hypothetical protein
MNQSYLGRILALPNIGGLFRAARRVPAFSLSSELFWYRAHPISRVRAKVELLSALRTRGIWLVDASVAALYRPGQSALTSREKRLVLETSWDSYTRRVVEAAEPEAVLRIGIGVVRALRTRLDTIGVPWAGVPQPQAHLSAKKHREISGTYAAVCADATEIRRVPTVV